MGTTQIREQTTRKAQDPGDVPSLRNQERQSLGWLEGMAHGNSGMDSLGLLFPGQEAPGLN